MMRQLGAMDSLMYYTDAPHAPSTIGVLELLTLPAPTSR